MARPKVKKQARYMNFYLSKEIADRIDAYSDETGIPKTRIVEDAIHLYLKAKENQEKVLEKYGNQI